jgi:Ca-activated chloride channel homolog
MKLDWEYGQWLIIAPLALLGIMGLAHVLESRYRSLTRQFSISHLSHGEVSRWKRFWKWLALALGVTLLCLGLADPRYGLELQTVSRSGRDIVFILDVSKSMLANDITPSRLKRAKDDIIDGLKDLKGHRVGLIVFAGESKEICPLTYDHVHFVRRLREVTPESVPKGGTNIGDALRMALDLIEAGVNLGHHRDLILITDGQDLTGYYEEVAKSAGVKKVSIYTLGIGQPDPTSIRLADGTYLKSGDEVVKTALNAEPLKQISLLSSDGFYQNLSTTPLWLSNISKVIESKEFARRDNQQQQRKTPRYKIFLTLAMFFIALSVVLPDRRKKEVLA